MRFYKFLILVLVSIILLGSCRKEQWDNRTEVSSVAGTESLMDLINADSDLSLFSKYLVKTGYDKVLASSKTFSVWAPDNTALEALDDSYVSDSASLKLFISNCIASQSFYSKEAADSSIRIRTYSGKRVLFSKDSINGIAFTAKDISAKNGVLYKINSAIKPQVNAFEYLRDNYATGLQYGYLKTLYYSASIDSLYRDSLKSANVILPKLNTYFRKINIDSEDSLLTYIVLTDQAYQAEESKLLPFFTDSTQAATDSVNQWNIIKDLTINGVIQPGSIPQTVYSAKDSLAIHLNASSIVKTINVSNGIVYVVNSLSYDLGTKIKPVTIEAESFYDRYDNTKSYTIRKRRDPATDSVFKDLLMENFGIASYWVRYPVTLNAVTYKVYWRAVNDFQTGTFPMMLAFNQHVDTAFADPKNIPFDYSMPYTDVGLTDYSDVYIGDFTPVKHGLEDVFLIGNNTTSNGKNTIVCDYIKLVPVLN